MMRMRAPMQETISFPQSPFFLFLKGKGGFLYDTSR